MGMNQFRNLVFEGGGVKGIAYAGAIKVLEEKGVMPDIVRVGGASAGAITAVLLSLGATWKDVQDIVGGTNFRNFMDDSWGAIRDTTRLLNDYGWFKGDAFSDWMKKLIYSFSGNTDLTFNDLAILAEKDKDRKVNNKFRQLYMVGTNLSLQLPEIYSAEPRHTPDTPIWKAVRISMSIPLFFAAMKNQNDNVLVDGGVTWNYPLDIFDDISYITDKGNTNSFTVLKDLYPTTYDKYHVYNKETLGARVDTKDEIKSEKQHDRLPPTAIESIVDYVKVLTGFMNDMANKSHLHANDWDRTMFIDALGVKTTDFSLSRDTVEALVNSGIAGAEEYFKWFLDPASHPQNAF